MVILKILALLIFTSAQGVLAEEFPEPNVSVRALGMGNAYTPVVDDKDSLFYNPAGLGLVEGFNFTILDTRLGADGADVIQSVQGASGNLVKTVKSLYGKNVWIGAGAKTAFTMKGFGLALYDSADIGLYVSNPAYPNIITRATNDLGLAAGIAVGLASTIHFGFTGHRINRIGAGFPIGLSTLGTLSSTDLQNKVLNKGVGYAADFGFRLGIPTPVKPTISFVWKNLGSTSFTKDEGSVAPPTIKDEMIAGFGITVDLMVLTIRPAVDFKHINSYEEQLGKKLHMGIEFGFPLVDVRTGVHQGYYTFGAGLDLGFFKFDAATYGVELGEYPGQHEDRRYIVSFTSEIGFDPSFNFMGGGGRRKGIKQRR